MRYTRKDARTELLAMAAGWMRDIRITHSEGERLSEDAREDRRRLRLLEREQRRLAERMARAAGMALCDCQFVTSEDL